MAAATLDKNSTMLQPGVQIRPSTTDEAVVKLAKTLYNLEDISITELDSYDDRNYRIKIPGDKVFPDGYVMKITNSLDSKKLNFIEAQNAMMLHLGARGIRCPQPIKNVHGNFCSMEKIYDQGEGSDEYHEHVVRLLTFQPGELFYHVTCTPALAYQAGCFVANIDIILKDFSHPAYDTRESLWMMKSVPELRKFQYVITDPCRHAMVSRVLEAYERDVEPKMCSLAAGMIHGDFNEQNILVQLSERDEWEIYAVLDFGDTQYSCYLFEVAITTCYMMLQAKDGDPLVVGGHCLAGYNKIRPVPDEEFTLLKTCISARICQSVVLGSYSHLQDPTNTYLTITQAGGWKVLTLLQEIADDELEALWRRIMASYEK